MLLVSCSLICKSSNIRLNAEKYSTNNDGVRLKDSFTKTFAVIQALAAIILKRAKCSYEQGKINLPDCLSFNSGTRPGMGLIQTIVF